MHAAMKAGISGLQVLCPLELRFFPPLLLCEHVMEALVVAAQHSLEITDTEWRVLIIYCLSCVTSHSLDVLFELLIIYPLQSLRSLAHRSLETRQFAGHLRYFSR